MGKALAFGTCNKKKKMHWPLCKFFCSWHIIYGFCVDTKKYDASRKLKIVFSEVFVQRLSLPKSNPEIDDFPGVRTVKLREKSYRELLELLTLAWQSSEEMPIVANCWRPRTWKSCAFWEGPWRQPSPATFS